MQLYSKKVSTSVRELYPTGQNRTYAYCKIFAVKSMTET